MVLTQKETTLLKDLQKQEEVCIAKYSKYSTQAHDQQLKDLFSQLHKKETEHLNTINQMMGGSVPSSNTASQNQTGGQSFTPTYNAIMKTSDQKMKDDEYLCNDALALEKHVSSVYNTSLFEFADTCARQTLNHIQKEEQQHGEKIYNYMSANGMY